MKGPEYKFEDLKLACHEKGKVILWNCAQSDASQYFNLRKLSNVLNFVANDGLEKLQHIDTRPLELPLKPPVNPNPNVDAYQFYSGDLRGYMAFFFQPITKFWNIKSFKAHQDGDDRFHQLAGLAKFLNEKPKS